MFDCAKWQDRNENCELIYLFRSQIYKENNSFDLSDCFALTEKEKELGLSSNFFSASSLAEL